MWKSYRTSVENILVILVPVGCTKDTLTWHQNSSDSRTNLKLSDSSIHRFIDSSLNYQIYQQIRTILCRFDNSEYFTPPGMFPKRYTSLVLNIYRNVSGVPLRVLVLTKSRNANIFYIQCREWSVTWNWIMIILVWHEYKRH